MKLLKRKGSLLFRGNRFQWWAQQRIRCWFGKHINWKFYEGKVLNETTPVILYQCPRCHTKFWKHNRKGR